MRRQFSPPTCVQKGWVGADHFHSVHVDPAGGLWGVRNDGVSHSVLFSSGVEPNRCACDEHEAAHTQFHCIYTFDMSGKLEEEPPFVIFTGGRATYDKASNHFFAALISRSQSGCISVFETVLREGTWSFPCIIHEARLLKQITCAVCAEASSIVLGCTRPDGHGEIIAVELSSTGQSQRTSLFRVAGPLISLTLSCDAAPLLVCVSVDGNVDVWDWRKSADVTEQYGNPLLDVARYGAPTSATVAVGSPPHRRLWVGTEKGIVVILPFSPRSVESSLSGVHPAPIILAAHRGPVSQLLPVCFENEVWSTCETVGVGGQLLSDDGDGSDVVCVWNAETCALAGSFVFPDGGLRCVSCGQEHWCSSFFGVERRTGRLASFAVTETPLQLSTFQREARRIDSTGRETPNGAPQASTPAAPIDLHSHMLALLQFASLQLAEPQERAPAQIEEALLALSAANEREPSLAVENLQYLPDALDTLAKGRALLLDGAADDATDVNREEPRTFLGDLQRAVEESRQHQSLECDVHEFLRSLPGLLGAPPATTVSTMDEAASLVAQWKRTQAFHAIQGPHSADPLDAEDYAAIQRQLKESQSLLSQREERIRQLEAALATSDKAAHVVGTDASAVFEMEAELHRAKERLDSLQADLQRLSPVEEERNMLAAQLSDAESLLAVYARKEELAQFAIKSFIDTQNALADEVLVLVANTRRRCSEVLQRPAAGEALRKCITDLEGEMITVEEFITDSLADQQEYFASLKSELLPS